MLEQHTTRDGTTMLIAQMDDRHLLNTIKLFSKALPEFRNIAESNESVSMDDILYNVPEEMSPEDAIVLWRNTVRHLQPYLAEALLRDAIRDDVAALMQERIQRSTALPRRETLASRMLVEGHFDEYDNDIPDFQNPTDEGFDMLGHP